MSEVKEHYWNFWIIFDFSNDFCKWKNPRFLFVSHNFLNINLLHINSDTLYISNTVKHERLLQIRQKPVYSSFCKFFANFTEICILLEKYSVTGQIKVLFIFSVWLLSLIIMFYRSKNLETNVKLFNGSLRRWRGGGGFFWF